MVWISPCTPTNHGSFILILEIAHYSSPIFTHYIYHWIERFLRCMMVLFSCRYNYLLNKQIFKASCMFHIDDASVTLAEWLTRCPAKALSFGRAGSNPAGDDLFCSRFGYGHVICFCLDSGWCKSRWFKKSEKVLKWASYKLWFIYQHMNMGTLYLYNLVQRAIV